MVIALLSFRPTPPGGEPCRRVGPFLDDIPQPERSLSFWCCNTSKRGITLSLDTVDILSSGNSLFPTVGIEVFQ